jgi:hypothetical protein
MATISTIVFWALVVGLLLELAAGRVAHRS